MSKRRSHGAAFKARVALAALKGERSLSERAAADAPYAIDADLPKAQHQQTRQGSQDLPLSFGRAAGGQARSGLLRRHHLSAAAARRRTGS